MISPKYISCPIINVIRQQEVAYPTCIYCLGKLRLSCEKRQLSKNKKNKLQVEDQYSLKCFRCHVIYKNTEISYRYRICMIVSINDYLRRVTVFGDSLDNIFGCTATEYENFKRIIFEVNAFEFNLYTFNALDYVISGELCILEISNQHLNDNNDVIANNIQLMKPNSYLNVIEYIKNFNNDYEEKWNEFFDMMSKLDERLIERLEGELEEVVIDNNYGSYIYQGKIQDNETQEQISEEISDTEIFVESAEFEHLDIELLYCQGFNYENSFDNLEKSGLSENCYSPFEKQDNCSFEKHCGDLSIDDHSYYDVGI